MSNIPKNLQNMDEIQKIIKEAIEKAGKGEKKEKVFEEARVKLLKLQEKFFSENKFDYNVLDDIRELAKKLGVKYESYD